MDWFKLAYELLGGLAIFFFGMKSLSESLQQISGTLIRKVIKSLTSNRVIALLVGLTVTTIVQSSSITTVMVVGFVNAGLMSLYQAIGVILGANIGTTITGWIIAIKIGKYSLLLLAVGVLPIIASKNEKLRAWGAVLFGLGMVFLGLQFMSGAFKPLRGNEDFVAMMTFFSADNYLTLWAAVGVGCALTFVIQSSSAMLGITIALASTGAISFQTACALVLGENIGTTITAMLACVGGNINGKRAAAAHTIFNVLGVVVITTFFWWYIDMIDYFVGGEADFVNPDGSKPYVAAHIAASHSVFNIVNSLLFLPFLPWLAKIVTKIIPSKEKEAKHLEFLGTNLTLSPSLAIVQAQGALNRMGDLLIKMIDWTKGYIADTEQTKLRTQVLKYETITDKIHQEIMIFMGHVMTVQLTSEEASKIHQILSISDEMESLGDYCQKVVHQMKHLEQDGYTLGPDTNEKLDEMFVIVKTYFSTILNAIKNKDPLDAEQQEKIRQEFFAKAEETRALQLELVKNQLCPPLTSLTVTDLTLGLSRIMSHSRKIAQAYSGSASTISIE